MESEKTLEIRVRDLRRLKMWADFSRLAIGSVAWLGMLGLLFFSVAWGQDRNSRVLGPLSSRPSSDANLPMASLLIRNGRVLLPNGSFAEAIACRGNRIVWIGSNRDSERWEDESTSVLDAHGGTVTPGMNDSHVHFLSGSLALTQIALGDLTTQAQVLDRIHQYSQDHPQASTVMGRGWLYGAFESGMPHRELLDAIVPDRPAVMRSYDGHTAWVNSVALNQAGITRTTKDPERGLIVRDEHGEATGVLKESAQRLLDPILPKPSFEEKCDAVRTGLREAHRLGITSIQEAGSDEEDIRVFASLQASGELALRLSVALSGRSGMTEQDLLEMRSLRAAYPELNIHAVKLFVDGVIESHTAVLLSPYANSPTQGLAAFTDQELERVVSILDRDEWNLHIHAIGDGGVRMSFDALQTAIQQTSSRQRARRHRLEHIETIQFEDIPRFRSMGIIASMQPMHASPNSNVFQVWAVNLGPERARRAWAWKSILSSGGRLAFGTDWPVVGLDPAAGLHVAITRQTPEGTPPDGFQPEQCVSLHDAIEAYTLGSAYAEEKEVEKGSLVVGKLADLVVWDKDLFQIAPSHLYRVQPRYTIFNGNVQYDSSSHKNLEK